MLRLLIEARLQLLVFGEVVSPAAVFAEGLLVDPDEAVACELVDRLAEALGGPALVSRDELVDEAALPEPGVPSLRSR